MRRNRKVGTNMCFLIKISKKNILSIYCFFLLIMLYIYCNHFLLNSIFNKKCVNLATKEHERSIKKC